MDSIRLQPIVEDYYACADSDDDVMDDLGLDSDLEEDAGALQGRLDKDHPDFGSFLDDNSNDGPDAGLGVPKPGTSSTQGAEADTLYDPREDDSNQKWIDDQRRKYQPKADHPKPLPKSDAVLNCPFCMTLLCLDCQRRCVMFQKVPAEGRPREAPPQERRGAQLPVLHDPPQSGLSAQMCDVSESTSQRQTTRSPSPRATRCSTARSA